MTISQSAPIPQSLRITKAILSQKRTKMAFKKKIQPALTKKKFKWMIFWLTTYRAKEMVITTAMKWAAPTTWHYAITQSTTVWPRPALYHTTLNTQLLSKLRFSNNLLKKHLIRPPTVQLPLVVRRQTPLITINRSNPYGHLHPIPNICWVTRWKIRIWMKRGLISLITGGLRVPSQGSLKIKTIFESFLFICIFGAVKFGKWWSFS